MGAALSTTEPLSSLRVLTWNIWFDNTNLEARMESISNYCEGELPDIICFQEVLPRVVLPLVSKPWARQYDFSDKEGLTVFPYGVLIMAKKTLGASFKFVDIPTRMERKLLIAEFSPNNSRNKFAVATVHLESLNSRPYRVKQLRIAEKALKVYSNSILCGDFNFCSYRNFDISPSLENDSLREIMSEYEDAWEVKYPASLQSTVHASITEIRNGTANPVEIPEAGFTFDSLANGVLAHKQYEQMRYDRIMLKNAKDSKCGKWEICSVELVGNKGFPINGQQMFASDHFGVLASLEFKAE